MRKNIMRKNLLKSIWRSLGRYIAIMAIIALGAGLFVGLLATKTDMLATGQEYMDRQNMFDLRLLSPVGWDPDSVTEIVQMDGIACAEGLVMIDAVGTIGQTGSESVYQIYSLPEQVNKVYLLDGRLPMADDECLIDSNVASQNVIGSIFSVSPTNADEVTESLVHKNYKIVGTVNSPLFMDMMRGTTSLGNGAVSAFVYIPKNAFSVDYYTQVDVTLDGAYTVYSDAYTQAMDRSAEQLEELLPDVLQDRYDTLRRDGQRSYQEGLAEYEDGLRALEQGKADAREQLSNAHEKLLSGQAELEENKNLLEDAKQQLEDGAKQLADNRQKLEEARAELEQTKTDVYGQLSQANMELLAQYQLLTEHEPELDSGLQQINDGIAKIDDGISLIDSGLSQLDTMILTTKLALATAEETIRAAQEALDEAKQSGILSELFLEIFQQQLTQAENEKKQYDQQLKQMEQERAGYVQQREKLIAQKQELELKKAELMEAKNTIAAGKTAIMQGFVELQHQTDAADKEFAEATAQLIAANQELNDAQKLLEEKQEEYNSGLAEFNKGQLQLEEGWSRYYKAVYDTARELIDGEEKLVAGKEALDEAKRQLDQLKEPEAFVLTRNTNIGYLALENNSNIVSGVARVFPAFFLLVASLVCITTMTRMVEDERTQIGTLKALGYSSLAIMSKYFAYAGSAAVLGCGLGVFVGSIVFPKTLWSAYSLILKLTPELKIVFDIPLCLTVVVVYTVVIVGVTWYCCRKALTEVPAQLIRPKAPTTGKKILLEFIPLWDKLSFLNKVMLRNIFRYRQRLLMMLIGIGGCTALLVTGFGIGDSIKDIVDYQFREVTPYDIQVQFSEGLSGADQDRFKQNFAYRADQIVFSHQSGVDVDYGDQTRSVYMICAYQDMELVFDLHNGEQQLYTPGCGEALLSVGTAEAMGIHVGDQIIVRNTDMEELSLQVSGIFENHVYNYVVVSPETITQQLGKEVQFQMAYISVHDGDDPHSLGADISERSDVMNVMISADLAEQVGSMLEAMNMVVATVIVCAGLLAVIVIYNLTNINITEREREIATIKVLGFTGWETAAYVFKENMLLSVLGAGIGLIGGKYLLDFVMSQIKIDMVWMQARIASCSLIASVVITIMMAVLVDFVLYSRLEKIKMAEALKAVE